MATQWTAIVMNTPVSVPTKVDGHGSFAEAEVFTRQKLSVVVGVPLASLSLSSIQPACQPEWTIGTTHCSVVYICSQTVNLGPILQRLEALEEKFQTLLLGQLAYALMHVVRNYVYNNAPPKQYGGSQPNVSSLISEQPSMSSAESARLTAVLQYINSKLPSKDYKAMDKALRKLRLSDAHSVAEQHTASSQYLVNLAQSIHDQQFRDDVISAIQVLSVCSSSGHPLAPDLNLQFI